MTKADDRHSISSIVGILVAIGLTLLMAIVAYSPDSDQIAAVFPPWWENARVFQAAGRAGRIVGVGRFRAILIVHGKQPGLADRLRGAGALFTVDANALGGCVGPT